MDRHPCTLALALPRRSYLIISAMLAYTLPFVNDVWNASCAVSMALRSGNKGRVSGGTVTGLGTVVGARAMCK